MKVIFFQKLFSQDWICSEFTGLIDSFWKATSGCHWPHPFWLSPSLPWQVGHEHIVLHGTQRNTIDAGDGSVLRVRLRSTIWPWESFLSFAHMKLVETSLTAAAFHRACHCLHLCLQNTKWAVARNEPLHFLTAASQPNVSVVPSQMFPQHSHVAWHYVLPRSWITKWTILNY